MDLVSTSDDTFEYYENLGSPIQPSFTLRTMDNSPVSNMPGFYVIPPVIGDLTGDGLPELLTFGKDNVFAGGRPLNYFTMKRQDNVFSGSLSSAIDIHHPWYRYYDGFLVPASADMDGDGDYDMVSRVCDTTASASMVSQRI